MPPTTLTTSFSVTAFGAISPTTLGARLAAVRPDNTLPNLWGLLLVSDDTAIVGQVATRTFVHLISPGEASASISCALETGETGAPVISFTVDSPGDGYAGKPFLATSPLGSARKAVLYPNMQGSSLAIIKGGTGYPANATLNLRFSDGQLALGGVQATGRAHVSGAGVINAVFLDTPGGPYNCPPEIAIEYGSGSGAYIQMALNIASLLVVDHGKFWTTAPTVTVTPLYYRQCGSATPDYLGPMRHWMTGRLQAALQTTVRATEPVAA